MSVASNRSIIINMSGDILFVEEFQAAENSAGPGTVTLHALITGNNTITVPTATGFTVKAATIIPPEDNTATLILKGVGGDTGVTISKTDPTSIAFETAPASFVLNAGASIDGLRIVWS